MGYKNIDKVSAVDIISENVIVSEVIVEKDTMAMSQETPDFKEKRYGKKTVLSKKEEENTSSENSDNTTRDLDKENYQGQAAEFKKADKSIKKSGAFQRKMMRGTGSRDNGRQISMSK